MGKVIQFQTAEAQEEASDMVPIEEWDGDCWKTMFNTLAESFPENDPWDNLAMFIKGVFVNPEKAVDAHGL